MKYILLFLMTNCLATIAGNAQTVDDSIKMAVNKFFSAMKASDSRGLKDSFTDSAILQSVSMDKNGNTIVEDEKIREFIGLVSKLPSGDADERIEFNIVKVDGPLAIVWAPYRFYYKGKFSHCGVDSFQLVRINGEWKIQYLIDTRRKDDCG